MSYLQALSQKVLETIQSGRIGRPVFVRCTVTLAADGAQLKQTMAKLAGAVNEWYSAPAGRTYAIGSAERGHVTLILEYASGATALISVAAHQPASHIDLTVLGTQGVVYHRESIDPVVDGAFVSPVGQPGGAIIDAVSLSTAANRPVRLTAQEHPHD